MDRRISKGYETRIATVLKIVVTGRDCAKRRFYFPGCRGTTNVALVLSRASRISPLQLYSRIVVFLTVPAKKNYLIGLLSITTLAAGIFAWHEHQQLVALQDANEQAVAKLNADWKNRLALAEQHARDLESALASARHRADAARDEELAGGRENGRGGRGRGGPDGRFGDFLAMMDDPKFAKLMATEQRGQLDSRYAALFKSLKLSPEDLEKFKNLLVEKQNSIRDVAAAARAQGIDPRTDRAAYQQLVSQTNAEEDAAIQATLGAAGFQQYQQYEQTMPERNLVGQLDQRLSYSSVPLTSDQQDQLVQLLAQSAPPANTDNPGRGGPGGPRYNVTDQAISQASAVLAPDQVAALQQLQQEQQAQRALFQQMRNQQPTTPTNGTGATGGTTAPVLRVSGPSGGVPSS